MPVIGPTRVGDGNCFESLTVFPLFSEADSCLDYLLADEAMGSGAVKVEEISESGSVPNLLVDNQTEGMVLFLEGEELKGARQNRILNTSVLAPARSLTTIPVSCVEQGRWRYISRHFGSSGHHSSRKLRHILRKSVTSSTEQEQTHSSDQAELWREVVRQSRALGTTSPTLAMADTYGAFSKRLAEFHEKLSYVNGATGLAVGIGKRVASVDLFDKASTCRKIWNRLLTGMIMEALEPVGDADAAQAPEVEKLLVGMRDAPWQTAKAIGAGDELRAKFADDRQATALMLNGTLVHGSLLVAA